MKFTIAITKKAKQLVNNMNTEALLRQVMCPQFFAHSPADASNDYGSFFFHKTNAANHKKKIEQFKKHCSLPPLITTDMENGPGSMVSDATQFPSMMALGRTNDESLAYEAGKAAAEVATHLGFNWTLSPCVDLCANADSPMVSTRSIGNDPDQVISIAGAYLRGMQDNGLIATLKHFPSDGFDTRDQHLTVANNPLSKSAWFKGPGRIYQALIDAGAMAVMPGHISLGFLCESDRQTGLTLPASLSKPVLTGLLKQNLGFDGLIVSDAVNMGGFGGVMNIFDACATFLNAGGDIVLFPPTHLFIGEMQKRVALGQLPRDILTNRALRIISLKDTLGILDEPAPHSQAPDNAAHTKTAKSIANKSVECVRNIDGVIPCCVDAQARVAHVIIDTAPTDHRPITERLTHQLRLRCKTVEEFIPESPEALFEQIWHGNFDMIICSICQGTSYGTNTVRLNGPKARLMMGGWMHIGPPVVFVAHHHPFVGLEYTHSIRTLICTYGSTSDSIDCLVKGICGDIPLPNASIQPPGI